MPSTSPDPDSTSEHASPAASPEPTPRPAHAPHTPSPSAAHTLGAELVDELRTAMPASTITHVRHVPARPSQPVNFPAWSHRALVDVLQAGGVRKLWSHQAATANHARNGQDVIVATGTASGKSLGYQLPILTALAEDSAATALYLAPTKALAQDQRQALARLCTATDGLTDVMVATYDGDTPPEARRTVREQARVIITNPDMLHASILGNPKRWTRLLKTLRYVVIDEAHVYRGVFGAHVAMVLRRLLRVVGASAASAVRPSASASSSRQDATRPTRTEPTLILASATSADPAAHARRLTGRENIATVTEDGSPAGARTIALWEPGFVESQEGEHGAPVRRNANAEAADIMARVVAAGARTLSFVRSRRGAEIVAMSAAEELSAMGRSADAVRIAAYRAGYTPEDRRYLEKALDEGELLGVAATNALELGIDVGGLDAVVSAGFPGTITSFRQQAGRAGRRGQGALVVLVGSDNPMDTYLIHHPEDLLDRGVENTVFDPHNPYVLADHLVCAAAERPLQPAEIAAWEAGPVADYLLRRGVLRQRPGGIFADLSAAEQIHGQISIRGGAAEQVALVEQSTGRMLGTVDSARAISEVHPGAVYVHQGETYVSKELDLPGNVAWLAREKPDYTTRVTQTTEIRILRTRDTRQVTDGVWLADVNVDVSHQVTHFVKRLPGGQVLDKVPLDYPPESLRTRAVAYTIEPDILLDLGLPEPTWPGTLHAAEHAAIGLLPLIATCDRWDIGGVSIVQHQDTGLPTVFVYDGYTGGAGFAEKGYSTFARWMKATADVVESCPCESGCPSCVQSPKCGNGNDPLFKQGAAILLRFLSDATSTTGSIEANRPGRF